MTERSPPLPVEDMGFDGDVLRYFPSVFVYEGNFLTCGGGLPYEHTEVTRECHYYSLEEGVSVDKDRVGPMDLARQFAGSSWLNGR